MSLTQERINEIALECWQKAGSTNPITLCNRFLSRIREEQEAVAYRAFNRAQSCFEYARDPEDTQNQFTNAPEQLFTIPPIAPDCNQIISAFSGDEVPSFRQGAPSHELEYAVTAEDCSRWVNELVELRDVCKELVEALELIRKGDDSPRTLAMVALAKHKASMGEK